MFIRINSIFYTIVNFLLLSHGSNQNQLRETYLGAVVEYKPTGSPWDSTPDELLRKNSEHYINLISEASSHGADIIVFPEYGLTTLGVPRNRNSALPYLQVIPDIGTNPCVQNEISSPAIRNLSCAARNSRIYVVINVGEVQNCTLRSKALDIYKNSTCHPDGRRQFNTNVVFNREGRIVAKYHKHTLYFEEQFESLPHPILSVFKSDFGVAFGNFICFDMMFYEPAVQLIEQGIRNILYPTAWVDELPFLMALQSQGNWAAAANVNLLASGYHQPLGGQLGSGIFSGKAGALNYTFHPDSGTKLILAEVPIIPDALTCQDEKLNVLKKKQVQIQAQPQGYHSWLRENLKNYGTVVLKMNGSISGESRICHNQFCCSLQYELKPPEEGANLSLNYRLIAFNGFRKTAQDTAEFGWQVCGVTRCLNATLESCGENDRTESSKAFPNFVHFHLSVEPFRRNQTMDPALNAMDINFSEIPFQYFEFQTNGEISRLSSDVLSEIPVQTIAIINRIY